MNTWMKVASASTFLGLLIWGVGRYRHGMAQPLPGESAAVPDLRDAVREDMRSAHFHGVAKELADCLESAAQEECSEGVMNAHRRWLAETGVDERKGIDSLIDEVLQGRASSRAKTDILAPL